MRSATNFVALLQASLFPRCANSCPLLSPATRLIFHAMFPHSFRVQFMPAPRQELQQLFFEFDGPPPFLPEPYEPTRASTDCSGATEAQDAIALGIGLPDSSWRWLSPTWVVESTGFFDMDRHLDDAYQATPCFHKDGWLYASDWPHSDMGYLKGHSPQCLVRCRRWVRPREKLGSQEGAACAGEAM